MSWSVLIYSCWTIRFWGSSSFGDGLVDLSRHLHGAAQLLLAITGAGLQLGAELVDSEQVVQVSEHSEDIIYRLTLGAGEASVAAHHVGHLLAGVNLPMFHLSLDVDGSVKRSLVSLVQSDLHLMDVSLVLLQRGLHVALVLADTSTGPWLEDVKHPVVRILDICEGLEKIGGVGEDPPPPPLG